MGSEVVRTLQRGWIRISALLLAAVTLAKLFNNLGLRFLICGMLVGGLNEMILVSCWVRFLASGKCLVSVSRCCCDHATMIFPPVTKEIFP